MAEEISHIKDYHCVEEHQAIEQDISGVTTHHVTFDEDTALYTQLLTLIRGDGFELVSVTAADDGALDAVFIETDDAFNIYKHFDPFVVDKQRNWVDDIEGPKEAEDIDLGEELQAD